ncbi:NAD(P)/FAD-dependent oxidoreductase [Porticoccus sp. W117]|uniref:NAD(P)/FAD-dependent oxidoreductase n=1 Tax=Porticoccus sp. W117 TaxID=3054777 RepID=UPI00259989AE|nr:NAD(P)/FAD-dependent oxidoreductase [Porticoccus sp. W117]MDM3871218.1 NAD(P)/FAD-dependent oxidoreductase [Porticoccus sp. W117]
MKNYDVIVVGAGAAGLMCAITAGQRGRSVLVLERANKVGKKILMSGGGRCNFTNLYVEPENYLSANPHFCKSALSRYTQWDFIDLVNKHDIAHHEKTLGQLFCDGSSKQIVQMLLDECATVGVTVVTSCDVQAVNTDGDGLVARTSMGEFTASSVVVASGGLSIPTLGGSGVGYDIARHYGHKVLPLQAALVPFTFTDSLKELCTQLSGVSVDAGVSCNGESFRENILFTHRGLSGPAILQISSYWQPGNTIAINLLPDCDASQWLRDEKQAQPKSLLRTVLANRLPRKLVQQLECLWWQSQAQLPLAEMADSVLENMGEKLNNWQLKPAATEGYRTAEVTMGGVSTDGLSSKTMESQHQSGLYFIGEVVDVTGHLGGFNFQWAWASGYAAGQVV